MQKFLGKDVCHLVSFKSRKGQKIFIKNRDYRFYLYLLKKYKKKFSVKIFGFCLTPASVDLIVQAPYENEESTSRARTNSMRGSGAAGKYLLKEFMRSLQGSYQVYFEREYPEPQKTDNPQKPAYKILIENNHRSKIVVINSDRNLIDSIKYVEFIPVTRLNAVSPVSYPWSSCGLRVLGEGNGILDTQTIAAENDGAPRTHA